MTRYRFNINLSAEKFLRYYEGSAQAVIVRAHDGKKLQLPARNFRPFIQSDGIHGEFEVIVDGNSKIVELKKLT